MDDMQGDEVLTARERPPGPPPDLYDFPEVYAALRAPADDLLVGVRRIIATYAHPPGVSPDRMLRLLDPACGPANWLVPFARDGHHVAGNDLSREMVRGARDTLGRMGASHEIVRGDMRHLALASGPFDVALEIAGSTGLLQQREDLTVRAPMAGIWTAPRSHEMQGTWAPRGMELGRIIDPASFVFLSIVPQNDAAHLFNGAIRHSEVRLQGQVGTVLVIRNQTVVPGGQEELPTAALGWMAGGDIQLKKGDQTGTKAAENFYVVRSSFDPPAAGVVLLGSLTGQIRFDLAPETLLRQWLRMTRQLFLGKGAS